MFKTSLPAAVVEAAGARKDDAKFGGVALMSDSVTHTTGPILTVQSRKLKILDANVVLRLSMVLYI